MATDRIAVPAAADAGAAGPVAGPDAEAYAAATSDVGVVDRSAAGKLALRGPDRSTFLDGQVSNAVADLGPGEGRYATFLTPKGRIRGDLRVLAGTDPLEPEAAAGTLLLLCERVALQELFDLVRRYSIGHDVELGKRTTELGLLSLVGPAALGAGRTPLDAATADALRDAPELVHRDARLGEDGPAVLAVRTDRGADLLFAAERAPEVRAALEAAGVVAVPEPVDEVVRVESGRPRMGVELNDQVMPAEAGLEERAVSFTKGCYVGQETVTRLHWRGRPNRHLRGLRLAEPAAPGSPVLVGDREVGTVRSAAVSPRLGPIALAYLRREVEPGARVAVDGAEAVAVALPFDA